MAVGAQLDWTEREGGPEHMVQIVAGTGLSSHPRQNRDAYRSTWPSLIALGEGPLSTPCWLWTAGKDRYGYGRITSYGKRMGAHRYIWILYHRDVPQGLELDHLCRVRHCVNPAHMELVTHKENMRRGIWPGRQP